MDRVEIILLNYFRQHVGTGNVILDDILKNTPCVKIKNGVNKV